MRRAAEVTRPDLRAGGKGKPPRQMSMMHVFRTAAEHGDARVDQERTTEDADADRARRIFRDTVDEAELRRHLALDLESLISTVRLDASVPLPEDSRIARSVVNYGFADLSRAAGTTKSRDAIAETIRASLLSFEPRLVPGSVTVSPGEDEDEAAEKNRLTFRVEAEIAADPADLPLDFVAEVDLGAGKLRTRRLRTQR
ncbi:type VI secretion system baseplate subunit TssE [Jannaschia marina]|uniref:type VI secretion system baseplate subunit TssE n=1 Tax=Jannaschia marina TaxID=2741674 RepID=UPI0015CDA50C|nr:type VI secretion system baseplate subunit TssE [Jannaschia marina]